MITTVLGLLLAVALLILAWRDYRAEQEAERLEYNAGYRLANAALIGQFTPAEIQQHLTTNVTGSFAKGVNDRLALEE